MALPSDNTKSQYHHFVPRFILRNFVHPFKPQSDAPKDASKRSRRKKKDGYYPGEPMLHTINLAGNTAEVVEAPVSKTLGMTDMYRDFAAATNQHELEEKLSKLECRVGEIIGNIRKAFEAGKKDIWITRPERDVLRKFLFIMKYRGLLFHKRFFHESREGYSCDDKERLMKYMREKGFKRPLDVWFDNIKAMLEMKMDPERKWMDWLLNHAYPDDANWFIAHSQMMYLALCTPSGKNDEFLLTENAYGIFEGPVSMPFNADTNQLEPGPYTEFHCFSVISPKLIMVLRSFILPDPEEDADEEIRTWRCKMFELNAAQHTDPLNVNSILRDLPITKARNSYTKLVNGRPVSVDKEDGSPRIPKSYDKFCFRFFPLSMQHTDMINSIMLEQSAEISKIIFKTPQAARKTLETYLQMPCELSENLFFKNVGPAPGDPALVFLKKLEQVVKQLGSNVTAIYHEQMPEDMLEAFGRRVADKIPKEPTEYMKLYQTLGDILNCDGMKICAYRSEGGNVERLFKDMDQAAKMLNMRIKIDVWSNGLREDIRGEIREQLRIIFCQLPARRLWIYLKQVKYMLLKGKKPDTTVGSELNALIPMFGEEDTIVNGKCAQLATW
ncbi:MAG: hypothetical protein Q9167_007219 [Letrouitia subvulpina]